MSKFNKILLYVLFGISIVIGVIFYLNSDSESMVYMLLNWCYILLAICLVCTIIMPLFFSNGKSKKGLLIKLGIAVVVCVISYLLASGSEVALNSSVEMPSQSTLKLIDAGMILTCILIVVAFLSIIAGPFINKVRK